MVFDTGELHTEIEYLLQLCHWYQNDVCQTTPHLLETKTIPVECITSRKRQEPKMKMAELIIDEIDLSSAHFFQSEGPMFRSNTTLELVDWSRQTPCCNNVWCKNTLLAFSLHQCMLLFWFWTQEAVVFLIHVYVSIHLGE